jgi:glycosyltransferase involved in cell wall biosynthesis
MNIIMMTNTYKPIVGGLEKSIEIFSREMRKKGHEVLIIAPEYKDAPKEDGVVRIPAIQHFNGTDFSVQLPIPLVLTKTLNKFEPDIVHSHHPFLIGDTALRTAVSHKIPLVFTFHTLYEKYTHYVPGESKSMKKFVIELSTGYSNLCDYVFAPSESVAEILKDRGVKSPIEINPTGIYTENFKTNDVKDGIRKSLDIPKGAYVIGYAGRVEPEKNMVFLAKAVSEFITHNKDVYFLILGKGSELDKVKAIFKEKNIENQLRAPGVLKEEKLRKAYGAMDVFAFASLSETQGLVLVEAMAAKVPVVAIDAPGVREVLKSSSNGYMVQKEELNQFVEGLKWIYNLKKSEKESLSKNALRTAEKFDVKYSINRALEVYKKAVNQGCDRCDIDKSPWQDAIRNIKAEWQIAKNITKAAKKAAEK